ncbi:Uncharacterised protein [Mycobacteroides abscessus subsp. abscessus]|nr:Uncharacterised protein [Mycobacteroides abscessus subsp. abscessus]
MPRTKLVKVDNQDSKDDGAVTYKMTFQAFRDKEMGFSVLQGWCGPGWLSLRLLRLRLWPWLPTRRSL